MLHHWQALAALKADDLEDACDHVQHVLDAVSGDPTHMDGMRAVLAALDADDHEAAEHRIEAMLAGRAEPGLTREMLSLQMALHALERSDPDDATHHSDHFLALRPGDADAAEILRLMRDGDHDDAMTRLTGMLQAIAADMPAMGTETTSTWPSWRRTARSPWR